MAELPEWAAENGTNRGGMPVIDVDADAAYTALLADYRAHYAERVPNEWLKADGELRKEWADCLDDLNGDEPSAYWCEVAYQSIKLDLQLAMRSFAIEIRIHDPEKRWRQADRAQGRGPEKAAGGLAGGREAREHYRRLRGFLPA